MSNAPTTNSSVFRLLCRVLGGQDQAALKECIDARLIPQLFDMAETHDLLPALAVRCNEQGVGSDVVGEGGAAALKQALMDNTQRNMTISAQALKLTRQLNHVGITPLFLKGTARLLTSTGGNLGFRKQVDIDFIVQPDELVAAADTLLADGYIFCQFPDNASAVPIEPRDAFSAIKKSAAHHHLPPLVKSSYAATVELHRHFLPRRFQRHNPLEPLFGSAQTVESHGVTFKLPCTENQLIHLVLGKLVNDGHLVRRSFPIRDACDFIDILEDAGKNIDQKSVARRCGTKFIRFHALVCEIMGYRPRIVIDEGRSTANYIRIMQKRYDSPVIRMLLDAYGRVDYLAHELAYSPGKLPAYLGRAISTDHQ